LTSSTSTPFGPTRRWTSDSHSVTVARATPPSPHFVRLDSEPKFARITRSLSSFHQKAVSLPRPDARPNRTTAHTQELHFASSWLRLASPGQKELHRVHQPQPKALTSLSTSVFK